MPTTETPASIDSPPCVGRAREIAALQSQLQATLSGGASFCHVTGEPGAGKSTLLRAFVSSVSDSGRPLVVAWGHCDPQLGKIRPLAPWAEILQALSGASAVGVAEERLRDNNSILQSVRSTLVDFAPDIMELMIPGVGLVVKSAKLLRRSSLGERLASNYGRPAALDVAADRSRLQDQYIAIIERVLDHTPLIILMDDLDFSDEASLGLLQRLVDKTRERRILFLVAMRPALGDSEVARAIERISGSITTIGLDLDAARVERGQEFVAEYVEAVLPGADERFVRELAGHTGGNPLFVAELIKHLRGKGQLVQLDGRWQAKPGQRWDEVPDRIESVLAGQLATLDDELLDILQAGSIEGPQFSIEVVAAALELSPVAVSRALARRAPGNLVVPLGSHPLGRDRVNLFRFAHSLARQHIYSGIDPLERIYLHRAVAHQLETLAGDDTANIATQLAFQFEQAQVDDKAIGYYELAAEQASASCSLTEAVAHLERALSLSPAPLAQMGIKHRLAGLKLMVGESRKGARLCAEAASIAEREGSAELGIILADQALALLRVNEFDTAWDVARRAEQLARDGAQDSGLLSALETLAQICSKRGERQQALNYQAEAMALAERLADDAVLGASLAKWGWLLKELGRYDEARTALERSLVIQKEGQPNYSQFASTCNALADLHISLENYDEARRNLLLAIESWRRFDRNADVAIGLGSLANLANREGLFEEALDYGRQAYREDIEVLGDDHPELAFSLSCIGESLIGLGEYREAIEALEAAYALRRKHHAPAGNTAWTGWLLGRALVESGIDTDRGRHAIQAARAALASMETAAQSELKEIDDWLARHSA